MRLERKGGKGDRTVLTAPVARAIDDYLAGRTTGPIFVTKTARRMGQPEAWKMVRRIARQATLDGAGEIRPHSLRVAFITGAREAGVPLEDVQDAAGHADPRTTRRYDRGRHSLDRARLIRSHSVAGRARGLTLDKPRGLPDAEVGKGRAAGTPRATAGWVGGSHAHDDSQTAPFTTSPGGTMRRLRALSILAAVAAIVAGTLSAQSASAQTIAQNWGGYTLSFANPDPQNNPLGASAIWTVPGVNCTQNGTPITNTIAEWVGLGGTSNQYLEQTGTAQACTISNGKAITSYYPWYEFTGCTTTSQCAAHTPKPVKIPDHVYKGDNMGADVVEQGPGYFVTQLWDHGSTAHPSNTWYAYALYQDNRSSVTPPLTADWVFEDMHVGKSATPPLPKFSPAVLFQNCYWNQDGATNELGSGNVNPALQVYTDSTQVATTSPLGADNMSFSVQWRAYG